MKTRIKEKQEKEKECRGMGFSRSEDKTEKFGWVGLTFLKNCEEDDDGLD